jgi:hypothetical protein
MPRCFLLSRREEHFSQATSWHVASPGAGGAWDRCLRQWPQYRQCHKGPHIHAHARARTHTVTDTDTDTHRDTDTDTHTDTHTHTHTSEDIGFETADQNTRPRW